MKKIVPIALLLFISNVYSNIKDGVNKSVQTKNILFLIIDDLRPELKSFGASHIHSPNIDALAEKSRIFLNQYVNAPSCGPSRYSALMGRYGPTTNNALELRGKAIRKGAKDVPISMPQWFKQHGYNTISVGKVSHYPGGRLGKNWDDDYQLEMPNSWTRHLMPSGEWKTPKGMMHGSANGKIRKKVKDTDVFQSVTGGDNIYPDGLITDEALKQINLLSQDTETPFFLAVGIIKPHLPFGSPRKYLDLYDDVIFPQNPYPNKPKGLSTWHGSNEFMKYNRWGKDPRIDKEFADKIRRYYAASVSYADAQVGKILQQLKISGADKNTIIVLWGDHGWNLGEHAIWGKHSLFEESLRSPLLISYPYMPQKGKRTKAIVEATDIFPTLTELVGISSPEHLVGKSLMPQLEDPKIAGHYAYSYQKNNATLRMKNYRLTLLKNKKIHLYDHTSTEKETKNVANTHPDMVKLMLPILKEKMTKHDHF